MTSEEIEGNQAELGRAQGFVPLQVRYEMTHDTGTNQTYPSMVCRLRPSADEIARIVAGEPLELRIIGVDWPPVDVTVGKSPYNKQSADNAYAFVVGVRKQRAEERLKAATAARVAQMKATLANVTKKK